MSDDAFESARCAIEVHAGLIPRKPIEEFTRRWFVTSTEWQEAQDQGELLARINGMATGYAQYLMLQPDRLNWVQVEWVWF